jgi:predicted peroxiredoxin
VKGHHGFSWLWDCQGERQYAELMCFYVLNLSLYFKEKVHATPKGGDARKYFYASGIVAMGFLGAIFIISQGVNISSKSVVLAQKAASKGDSGWIQVVNNVLSDRQTDAVHPVKAATNKLALEANAPQARLQ